MQWLAFYFLLMIASTSPANGETLAHTDPLQIELNTSQQAQQRLNQEWAAAENEVLTADSSPKKQAAQAKLNLLRYRLKLTQKSVSWIKDLKKAVDKYELIAKRIFAIEGELDRKKALQDHEIVELYQNINKEWRTLLDDGFLVYHRVFDEEKPDAPPTLAPAQINIMSEADVELWRSMYEKAASERIAFFSVQRQNIEDRFEEFYRLLAQASQVRSRVISILMDRPSAMMAFDDYFVADVTREIIAIPFRFLGIAYQKYAAVRINLSKGVWGFWLISQNIVGLMVLLILPFVARGTSRRLTEYIDKYRTKLLYGGAFSHKKSFAYALWIRRILPYIPWLFYGGLLRFIHERLQGSILDELRLILPIFGYIILYKILRLLLADLLSSIRNRTSIHRNDTKNLINFTSRLVGYFFLFSLTALHLTQITVAEGLLYRMVDFVMQAFGFIICSIAAYSWRDSIAPAAKAVLAPQLGSWLARRCEGFLGLFVCLPALAMILFTLTFESAWGWLSQLETSKKFLARIYRKKIESMVGEKNNIFAQPVPESYFSLFEELKPEDKDLIVDAHPKAFALIKREIDGWLSNDEEEQSVAIYGEKGIGKTMILNRIAAEYHQLKVIRLSIPPKIWQKEHLKNFLAEKLELDPEDGLMKAALEFNKKAETKTLVLVDDAHNLFLGRYGGFEALHAFIEMVNLKTDKVFWCSAFNLYSWAYLKGVLGGTQYLRAEVWLNSWSDDSIKQLIMSRHGRTEFKLSYDQVILASRSLSGQQEAVVHAEEQFFRLLWEQSSGNPSIAMYHWIHCLQFFGQGTLRVCLPERSPSDILGKLDDNFWFVLAAIAKHENLNRSETTSTTSLAWPQVAHAIKLGVENKLIYMDGNRYRLHFTTQYDVIKQLKIKNFIYGIN